MTRKIVFQLKQLHNPVVLLIHFLPNKIITTQITTNQLKEKKSKKLVSLYANAEIFVFEGRAEITLASDRLEILGFVRILRVFMQILIRDLDLFWVRGRIVGGKVFLKKLDFLEAVIIDL